MLVFDVSLVIAIMFTIIMYVLLCCVDARFDAFAVSFVFCCTVLYFLFSWFLMSVYANVAFAVVDVCCNVCCVCCCGLLIHLLLLLLLMCFAVSRGFTGVVVFTPFAASMCYGRCCCCLCCVCFFFLRYH